ncbi:hypothetical protein JQ633_00855 [Bradyrhizobium tropiciagri]|uniref:hypothetical protein n=1 Tax=Bradyrhizobium tropiciagri TaxID=312253 RepID=UPI001BAD3C48|nr:hypothetical protein [Bradyrhizobium tropiciagri]MBR0868889.1 hypothetical protein [Bradyrhizobium tropiciagri]
MPNWLQIVLIVGIFIVFYAYHYRSKRNGKWHSDGSERMRRYVNGKWEYRPTTKNEHDEHIGRSSW